LVLFVSDLRRRRAKLEHFIASTTSSPANAHPTLFVVQLAVRLVLKVVLTDGARQAEMAKNGRIRAISR
jgi:hypothetical protein